MLTVIKVIFSSFYEFKIDIDLQVLAQYYAH